MINSLVLLFIPKKIKYDLYISIEMHVLYVKMSDRNNTLLFQA